MIRDQSNTIVVVRGAGDVGSGVIHRLHTAGYYVIALEIPNPVCVRRAVCFGEAVYDGEKEIEGVLARSTEGIEEVSGLIEKRIIPVVVDPEARILDYIECGILIDARMLKVDIDTSINMAELVIGLGPGFMPGDNCHLAVETIRGNNLGMVLRDSSPREDTGVPAPVEGFSTERVIRAPVAGILNGNAEIGDFIRAGEIVAHVDDLSVRAETGGVLRGLCRNGIMVAKYQKIGDIDPRGKRELCFKISDKAEAIADGVLSGIRSFERSKTLA